MFHRLSYVFTNISGRLDIMHYRLPYVFRCILPYKALPLLYNLTMRLSNTINPIPPIIFSLFDIEPKQPFFRYPPALPTIDPILI
jgi:hypothetical protein